MKAEAIIAACLDTRVFGEYGRKGTDRPLVDVRWIRSRGSRFVLVVGENASGKSLFRRMAAGVCRRAKPETEFIGISMQMRTTDGMHRVFVYGHSESTHATSVNSVNSVLGGIRTCQGRAKGHVIFWDEPDVGMSDGTILGVGAEMVAFAGELPEKTEAAFVVTHSRLLASALAICRPHMLFVGTDRFASLQEWLDAKPEPVAPQDLQDRAHKLFRRVAEMEREAEREERP